MNNKISSFLILLCLMVFYMPLKGYAFNYAKAKVTIKVVDDYGEPVKDAKVVLGFSSFGEKSTGCRGGTDSKGLFSGSGRTHGEFSWVINKDRYYETTGVDEKWMRHRTGKIKDGKWQPWNPTIEVVLKKIENPVPMYARHIRIVPEIDKKMGFDFEKADWVAPYGKGIESDFIIFFKGKYKNLDEHNESLTITFNNEGDGIQSYIASWEYGSELVFPKTAPEDGYMSSWSMERYIKPDGSRKNLGTRDDQNFIFRVRTRLDKEGNIIKANYGKIHGGISFHFTRGGSPYIYITYYFNPDGTRNLESNPEKNLFKKSRSYRTPVRP